MSSLEEFAGEVSEDTDLRAALVRAQRARDKEKDRTEELVAAVYQAARDASAALVIPPVPVPKADRRRNPETAIAMLSDWQLGKRTPTYDSATCELRILQYGEKVLTLTDVQRQDHPVPNLRVWLLGDLVEGENIFPGQVHHIDSSLYRQVCVDGPRILVSFLRRMLSHFEKVDVVAVIGNHGRVGKRGEYHPETNTDRFLYRIVANMMEGEKRLTFTIPDGHEEKNWFHIDEIAGKRYLLFHGDQMRGGGFAGMPFYGFFKAINGWAAGGLEDSQGEDERFDYAACGHWHQGVKLNFNKRKLWVNGSTESTNTWTSEELKSMSRPEQWLLFASERGVTAEYAVPLT